MKNDRWLLVIMAGVLLLSALAVGLFLARRAALDYQPENSPANILYNYVLAIDRKDFDRAYGYLANQPNKPSPGDFRSHVLSVTDWAALETMEVILEDDQAFVTLSVHHYSRAVLGEGWTEKATAKLVKQDGEWKILNMPYPFFNYLWVQSSDLVPYPQSPLY
ncbi:MAG: hypothetical protein WHV66_13980 [Anaerolineales bacterium]